MTNERCTRQGCKRKVWAVTPFSALCLLCTEKIFRDKGVPTLFNRITYICQTNNMHLRDVSANIRSLRTHWQRCPNACKISSCPYLEGIPRAS